MSLYYPGNGGGGGGCPIQFGISRGGRGGCPIQFGISIYGGSYCIENTFYYFYMSDGCVMVENSGVFLFRNVIGWSFPWTELSAVVLMFGQSVPTFQNAKI